MKQDWKEVVAFARDILAHGNQKIIMGLLNVSVEECGEEVADEQNWQAFDTVIDKALNGKLEDPNDYDVLVLSAALVLREGQRLRANLAIVTADILEGKILRPTKRGPDPTRDWLRNCALSFAAQAVATKFGIARYENGNTNNRTAADAVSEAAKCTPSSVRNALKSNPLTPSLVATLAAQLASETA